MFKLQSYITFKNSYGYRYNGYPYLKYKVDKWIPLCVKRVNYRKQGSKRYPDLWDSGKQSVGISTAFCNQMTPNFNGTGFGALF